MGQPLLQMRRKQLNYLDYQPVCSLRFSRGRCCLLTLTGVIAQKRPLLRPPIPSPSSDRNSQKVVYISNSTPFLSAVNRVQKLLHQIQKRQTQSALGRNKNSKTTKDAIRAAAEVEFNENETEAVVIKGTGRAIERTMSIALFFLDKSTYRVEVKTGSVLAVDDLIPASQEAGEENTNAVDEEDLPESRIRYTSVLEAHVWLK